MFSYIITIFLAFILTKTKILWCILRIPIVSLLAFLLLSTVGFFEILQFEGTQ